MPRHGTNVAAAIEAIDPATSTDATAEDRVLNAIPTTMSMLIDRNGAIRRW